MSRFPAWPFPLVSLIPSPPPHSNHLLPLSAVGRTPGDQYCISSVRCSHANDKRTGLSVRTDGTCGGEIFGEGGSPDSGEGTDGREAEGGEKSGAKPHQVKGVVVGVVA